MQKRRYRWRIVVAALLVMMLTAFAAIAAEHVRELTIRVAIDDHSALAGYVDSVDPDTLPGGVQRLTDSTLHGSYPHWSRNGHWFGQWIMYTTEQWVPMSDQYPPGYTDHDLYRMRPDGSDKQLLADAYFAGSAQWSSDGEWIAFVSDWDGNGDIYRMRADGSDIEPLITTRADEFPLGWSPDGHALLYAVNQDDEYELYRTWADGSGVKLLTSGPGQIESAQWSPDSTQVLFDVRHDRGGKDISVTLHVIDARGYSRQRLTEIPDDFRCFEWTPDSQSVQYVVQEPDYTLAEYHLQTATTSTLPFMGENGAGRGIGAGCPQWSPDRQWIVYALRQDAYPDLYVMRADGSDVRRLTKLPSGATSAFWSPDGRWIAFLVKYGDYNDLYRMWMDPWLVTLQPFTQLPDDTNE